MEKLIQREHTKIAKRFKDPWWRYANLYYIKDKKSKAIKLYPNSVQKRINQCKSKKKRILKARQFGVSTNELIKQLDAALYTKNFVACILAHERDGLEKLFSIVKFAYDYIPTILKPELDRGGGSKYEMRFPENNSKIYCDLESRGDTINWLHISEKAFIKDIKRVNATKEAVPIDGIITEETTPNGMGNHFYDDWIDPNSTYEHIFFPWFVHDEYQIPVDPKTIKLTFEEKEFIEKAKRIYGIDITAAQIMFRRVKQSDLKSMFIQEYPEDDKSCFLASGDSAFELEIISDLIESAHDPLKDTGEVKIYKEYNRSHTYVIGVDTAEGLEKRDWSVAQVFDATKKEQVATLRCHKKPSDFAHAINDLAKQYWGGGRIAPLLAVERNNHGHAVILELFEHIKYPNLFIDRDERIGWNTDRVSRPIMMNGFIDAVEHRRFKIYDKTTLGECLTLVVNNGKIEASGDKHDDCITSAAIGIQVSLGVTDASFYDDLEDKIGTI